MFFLNLKFSINFSVTLILGNIRILGKIKLTVDKGFILIKALKVLRAANPCKQAVCNNQ